MRHSRYGVALPIVVVLAVFVLVPTSCALFASHSPSHPSRPFLAEGTTVTMPLPSSGCGQSAPLLPGSSAKKTISSGGLTRIYRLHLPPSYRPDASQAVILNFHGHGSNAMEQERCTSFSTLAD